MAIYGGFTHSKWWFSIAMLVYQRVTLPKLDVWSPKPGFAGSMLPVIFRKFTTCWSDVFQGEFDTKQWTNWLMQISWTNSWDLIRRHWHRSAAYYIYKVYVYIYMYIHIIIYIILYIICIMWANWNRINHQQSSRCDDERCETCYQQEWLRNQWTLWPKMNKTGLEIGPFWLTGSTF